MNLRVPFLFFILFLSRLEQGACQQEIMASVPAVQSPAKQQENAVSLRELLQAFRKKFSVDILYKDQLVEDLTVPALSVDACPAVEDCFDKVLPIVSLSYKKLENGAYLITKASRKASLRKRQLQEAMSSINVAQQDSTRQRIITGLITDENNKPLPGVNVVLKNTLIGTISDSEGLYSLPVYSDDAVLVYSFVGYQAVEQAINGRTIINVQMQVNSTQLKEVVVTALNIGQESRTLSYVTQQIGEEKINMTRANDIGAALAGKIAGIQVLSQSGAKLGDGTSIRVRGAGSLVENSILYVVDGTPIPGDSRSNSGFINPDDVESINILKGPAAVALYGQRGENGVMMITMKKAKKQTFTLDFSHNTFLDQVYLLPKQQNSYAGGSFSDLKKYTWNATDPVEWKALDGKYYHDYQDDSSWGPRMLGQEYIPWYAWVPGTDDFGKTKSLVPQPKNVRNYFSTGVNNATHIALSKGDKQSTYRISYTRQNQTGVLPNTNLSKHTVSLNTTSNFTERFSMNTQFNFVASQLGGYINDGITNQIMSMLNQSFHRDIEMDKLKQYEDLRSPGGVLVSWNHANPGSSSGDSFYKGTRWRNPYSNAKYQNRVIKEFQLFGNFNLEYKLLPSLTLSASYQRSQYTSKYEIKVPTVLKNNLTQSYPGSPNNVDSYKVGTATQIENNYQFLLTHQKSWRKGMYEIVTRVGANTRYNLDYSTEGATSYGLTVPDLFLLSNSVQAAQYGFSQFEKKVNSVYGSGTLSFKQGLFLNWSLRNDWSSALPKNNNSYLYGSVGISAILTEFIMKNIPQLSQAKVRFNIGQVGDDLSPYLLQQSYTFNNYKWNSKLVASTDGVAISPNIQPALSTNYEYGTDWSFFEGRLSFGVTAYKNHRINQILTIPISPVSGYSNQLINVGESYSKGVELQLEGVPVHHQNFSWRMNVNVAQNRSRVVKIQDNQTAYNAYADFGVSLFHIAGSDWGQIRGNAIARNADGVPILGATGLYTVERSHNFGTVLPNYYGGWQNYLQYKNFSLNLSVVFQNGGKYFSSTDQGALATGVAKRTAGLNDLGVPIRTDVQYGGGVHVTGVDAEGNSISRYVDARTYYQQFANSGIAESSIFSSTYVKLNEVALTYRLSPVWLKAIHFKQASFSITGRNLWMIYTPNRDFDASTMTAITGENGQLPGTQSFGFQVKFTY